MALPNFLQPYLPSYDISKLNKNQGMVKNEIVTQILNSGDDKAVRWLFKNFSLKEIKEIVRRPQKGVWYKNSLYYWRKILDLDISFPRYKKAIFDLSVNR